MVPLPTKAKRNKADTWLGFQLPQRPTPGGRHPVLFSNFLFCDGVWQPVNNIAILSDGQQRDSVTHIYTHKSILPQIPLPPRLPHNIEQSFLYCTVGPCWLHSSVYMSIPNFLTIPSPLLSPWGPCLSPQFFTHAQSIFISPLPSITLCPDLIISISTISKAPSPVKHNLHACSKGSLKLKAAKIWGVRIQNCKGKTMHRALECSSSEKGPPVGAPGHESTQHACFAHTFSMQHPSSYQISAAFAFGEFCMHMFYLTLCDSMDCSPLGSSVHGISRERILEWVAIFFLQGIFPTQGSNPCFLRLLHWQEDSLPLSYLGSQALFAFCTDV